ncbi:MAG TPA: glucosamine-6-phosphate deaminase [Mycobacteriales bacterium]|jgi:glucosamine-6-phosphate deaminase|nr:glucosamine-6-phosphate deaminase [Mycobacteriales bacterium]
MGQAAAADIAEELRTRLRRQAEVRMVFAAAPSQDSMLESLAVADGIDWSRVTALHMDEYVGIDTSVPQSFARYLNDRLFDPVRPGRVELIDGSAEPDAEARRYSGLLAEGPVDIVCLGIGENGHIAFNDPQFADFADPLSVKVVDLDTRSRQQQVNDGCFAQLSDVPERAITLTIPALTSGQCLFCVVPGQTKAAAVRSALRDPVSPACPATILREHPACRLYLDPESAPTD